MGNDIVQGGKFVATVDSAFTHVLFKEGIHDVNISFSLLFTVDKLQYSTIVS